MGKKKSPQITDLNSVISFFQNTPDLGGLIIQKIEGKVELDAYFSDQFLGKDPEERYSIMIITIAAMRNMADTLTKHIVSQSGVPEDQVRKNIADIYYEIQKNKN